MNLENIAKKISAQVECDLDLALTMAAQLTKVHEDLRPVVSAWLKDELIGFEHQGIDLDTIMKKEHVKYIQAIFSMSTLLSNPEFAAMYSDFEFMTDRLEG